MTDMGNDICGSCGRAGDYPERWRGVAFCSSNCRGMYALELAEQARDWGNGEVAARALEARDE